MFYHGVHLKFVSLFTYFCNKASLYSPNYHRTPCVEQAGSKSGIILVPLFPEWWDYRYTLPCLAPQNVCCSRQNLFYLAHAGLKLTFRLDRFQICNFSASKYCGSRSVSPTNLASLTFLHEFFFFVLFFAQSSILLAHALFLLFFMCMSSVCFSYGWLLILCWCWHMLLIPAHKRQRQVYLWVQGQPILQSELWDSQSYTEKPGLFNFFFSCLFCCLHNSSWPVTHYVDQASFGLTEVHVPLFPKYWD